VKNEFAVSEYVYICLGILRHTKTPMYFLIISNAYTDIFLSTNKINLNIKQHAVTTYKINRGRQHQPTGVSFLTMAFVLQFIN